MIINGKDRKYNASLTEVRAMALNVEKMAEEAVNKYASNKDETFVAEMKPYDEKFYGQLADIGEFFTNNMVITKKVLKKAGGKYSSLRQSDSNFWRPKTKVYTKDFLKKFPHLAADN